MNNKKMRKVQKFRSKPDDEEKLIFLKSHKRLISRKVNEAKAVRTVAVALRVIGGIMMIGTVSLWRSTFSIIPATGLALLGGIILAAIFRLAAPDGLDASNKIHKSIVLFIAIITMSLIINQATAPYSFMFLFALVPAVYLFGVVKTLPGLKP